MENRFEKHPAYKEEDLEIKTDAEFDEAKRIAGVTTHEEAIRRLTEHDKGEPLISNTSEIKGDGEGEKIANEVKEELYRELDGGVTNLTRRDKIIPWFKEKIPTLEINVLLNSKDVYSSKWDLIGIMTGNGEIYLLPRPNDSLDSKPFLGGYLGQFLITRIMMIEKLLLATISKGCL